MALSATQKKLICDLLDIGDDDDLKEYLFQSRKALTGEGLTTEEKSLIPVFLKSMDTAMKRLSIYYLGALEARNEEEAQETLKDLAGMWSDICLVLRSPTLATLNNLDSFVNSKIILAKLNRLKYLKPHLSHDLSSDDESVSRTKRAKVDSPVISTGNRFQALSEEPNTSAQPTPAEEEQLSRDVMDESEPEPPAAAETAKKPRVEPIFIALSATTNALIQHLNSQVLKHHVTGKLVGEHVKVIPGSPEDYRALTTYLRSSNINFHAILPREEKPMKILIKGLGSETPTADIAAELIDLGFSPHYISALRNRATGNKLPLFHVTLKQTPNWEKIYEVKILQSMYVTVQRFYSTAPKQCYRCQGFGHSSQTCYMPFRCLKCGQEHRTKECLKPRDIKPTCANCKGPHTANYQGCPANPRNKPVKLPFKQRYFQQLKEEKELKKLGINAHAQRYAKNNISRQDAPPPLIPAWLTHNAKIYAPPGANISSFPPLPTSKDNAAEQQPITVNAEEVTPPIVPAAEKRAIIEAANAEKYKKLAAQHHEIIHIPTIEPVPALSPPSSSLSDVINTFKEFQALMETVKLKELITLLKHTAMRIRAAPTEMDKLAVLLETANQLNAIFPSV